MHVSFSLILRLSIYLFCSGEIQNVIIHPSLGFSERFYISIYDFITALGVCRKMHILFVTCSSFMCVKHWIKHGIFLIFSC